ncbi:MAG: aminodeoxychorismate lyase [Gammaproteobacteria bacterium]|nr:aminodeoxychorismate lyase [Gammaproteobacteria bacterium]
MILVNGKPEDTLSLGDRAIHYGDGLFETIAVEHGLPLAWDDHMQRLQKSCLQLGIDCPDPASLLLETVEIAGDRELLVVKIIISRGSGGRGYTPAEKGTTGRIVLAYDWPDYPKEFAQVGIEAAISSIRLGHNPLLAGLKHLNRLEQVLLSRELAAKDKPETLVMDIDNQVIEGSKSNLFLVSNQKVMTPALDQAGVEGVIRNALLKIADELLMERQIGRFSLDDVFNADEVFFCNSIAGLWPVRRIENTEFALGPVSLKLQQVLQEKKLIT